MSKGLIITFCVTRRWWFRSDSLSTKQQLW